MTEYIHVYTREQAIEDGGLIRLEEYVRSHDFPRTLGDLLEQIKEKPGKFPLGELVITSSAAKQLDPIDVLTALARHQSGEWGDLDEHDRSENEQAVLHADRRIFSVYRDQGGVRFYIITEWNREATTVLLPEDY